MVTLGSTLLIIAGLLALLGALTWPPGGLMFALPFVFLMPAAILGAIGGLLLFFGRRRKRRLSEPPAGTA